MNKLLLNEKTFGYKIYVTKNLIFFVKTITKIRVIAEIQIQLTQTIVLY